MAERISTDNVDVAMVFAALEMTKMRAGTYQDAAALIKAYTEFFKGIRKAFEAEG